MITIKNPREIKLMREGGRIAAEVLRCLRAEILEGGVNAAYLDKLAEEIIAKHKATPSFRNYQGFPAAICVSINAEVVHGLPDHKIIREGDVVGLDVGVKYKNLYTDAAISVGVGKLTGKKADLIETCAQALYLGIKMARPGKRIGDLSWAIQHYVEKRGYSVVRELVGHGVGYAVHEEPRIPNFGQKGQGPILEPGMTLCLEPMINMGGPYVVLQEDGHTFQTADLSLSAHFEHTVAITRHKPLILTAE